MEMIELEQMKKDAERYRWLRSRPVEDCTTPRIEVNQWTCNIDDEGVADNVNEGEVLAGDELDAAIDAMISNALGNRRAAFRASRLSARLAGKEDAK
jgi:hypothetical protein